MPQTRCFFQRKEVPEDANTGTKLCAFLYMDSQDRMIATLREPVLELGGLAVLKVADVGRIGAFLDWGLEKTCCCRLNSRPGKCALGRAAWWRFTRIRVGGCVPP